MIFNFGKPLKRHCGFLALTILITLIPSTARACTPDENKSSPFSYALRSDDEIAAAISKAQTDDGQLHPYERVMIIVLGVFGPCFVVTLEEGQIVAWRTYANETDADKNRDIHEAVDKMIRVVILMRKHKIPDDIRPANIDFDLFMPSGSSKSRRALYRIHFSPATIRRAKNAQADSEKYIRDGFKVFDGELPEELRHPYGRR